MFVSTNIVLNRITRYGIKKIDQLRYYSSFKKSQNEVIAELMEYSKLSREKVLQKISRSNELVKNEWNQINPQTHGDISKAYSIMDNYIFDISNWTYFGMSEFMHRESIAKECKNRLRILDYGGGIGDMSIRIYKHSKNKPELKLTHYDVKGKTMEFAKWRFNRGDIDVSIINASDKKDNLKGKYDSIICLEVLEHVIDPKMHLYRIKKHLKRYGDLFITAPFGKTENIPCHMDSDKLIEDLLSDLTFKREHYRWDKKYCKWINK